jgi:hypothetical protein
VAVIKNLAVALFSAVVKVKEPVKVGGLFDVATCLKPRRKPRKWRL